ncbi:hypothetical protein ACLOJK_000155 [Asimina triloba]
MADFCNGKKSEAIVQHDIWMAKIGKKSWMLIFATMDIVDLRRKGGTVGGHDHAVGFRQQRWCLLVNNEGDGQTWVFCAIKENNIGRRRMVTIAILASGEVVDDKRLEWKGSVIKWVQLVGEQTIVGGQL